MNCGDAEDVEVGMVRSKEDRKGILKGLSDILLHLLA